VAICWDVGGQLGLRQLWSNYFEEIDGVIFVVDSCDSGRFNESCEALRSALDQVSLARKPLLFFANKSDREDAANLEDIAKIFMLGQLEGRPVKSLACSALRNDNLDEGIRWIVSEAVKYRQLKESTS
jgi:GTPase SAR1 family protein